MTTAKRVKNYHEAEQFNLPLNDTNRFPYQYPNEPGFKNKDKDGPSRKAANEIKATAPTLRERCLATINKHPMTADEVATTIDKSILSVRPRVAELAALGKIEDTGTRRTNSSGKLATVWRASA